MPRIPKSSAPEEKIAPAAPKRTRKRPAEAKPSGTARRTAKKPASSVTASSVQGLPVEPFEPSKHYAEIAEAAYYLWLGRNGQPGSPEEDWLRAEAEVRRRYTARSASASAS